LHSVDLVASEGNLALLVRLSGLASVLPARAERVKGLLGTGGVVQGTAEDEAQAWRAASELAWVTPGWTLVKVPLTPKRLVGFDAAVAALPAQRRYSAGGNMAWVATPAPVEAVDGVLKAQGLAGLVVIGSPGRALIGAATGAGFGERVRGAMDEGGRWAR
jgi:glycolate oxidase FAD binding subunit